MADRPQGLKQRDLGKCLCCGKGMMHGGDLSFLRLRLEHFVVDIDAVRRQHGLELTIGPLAGVMGPDRDLAREFDRREGLVCAPCALRPQCLFDLLAPRAADVATGDAA